MAKYTFSYINILHGVAIQINSKNNKKRLFFVESTCTPYKPIGKEHLDISHIANEQGLSPYVLFVCSDKKNKTIITDDLTSFKIRNWKKKIQPSVGREHDKIISEKFNKFKPQYTPRVVEQSDGLILFSHPYFGEVVYNPYLDIVSNSFEYISDSDKNGNRIACITTDKGEYERFYCLNKKFAATCKPFYEFVKDDNLALADGFHLIKYKVENGFLYSFLNENYQQCSEKYINVSRLHNLILATLDNGAQVFLSNRATTQTPPFIGFEKIGNLFLLKLDNNDYSMLFNPQILNTQPTLSMSDLKICENYRLAIGNIGSKDFPEYALLNTTNYNVQYNIDPDVSKLFFDFLNNKPVNIYIAKHLIKEPETIVKTLSIFQEFLKLYTFSDLKAGIKDREKLCDKFMAYLREITNQKTLKNSEYSKSQLAQMSNEYSAFIDRKNKKHFDCLQTENNNLQETSNAQNIVVENNQNNIENQSENVITDASNYVNLQNQNNLSEPNSVNKYTQYINLFDNCADDYYEDLDPDQLTIFQLLDAQQIEIVDDEPSL